MNTPTLFGCLQQVRDDLEECGASWALVGALGVAAWSEARATFDMDVAVSADPSQARTLVECLITRGYALEASFGQAMHSLAIAGGPDLRLDLLFGFSGIEDRVVQHAVSLEVLPGLSLPVAHRGDLMALKLLAAREPERGHDLADARRLLQRASSGELDHSRAAMELMRRRGTPNSDGLVEIFEELLMKLDRD